MFGKKNSLVKNLYTLTISFFIFIHQAKADNQPPHPEALQSWEDQTSTLDTLVKDLQDKKIPFQCDQPYLYPTHPDQSMKHYHQFKVATYDHFKIQGDNEICLIKAKNLNAKGYKSCFKADHFVSVVLSDLYTDSCGHFYRAYSQIDFFGQNENIGTLFSAGRTMFEDPKSEFASYYVPGHTYPVHNKDFLFFTAPTEDEIQKSKALKDTAIKNGFIYNTDLGVFN